MTNRDIVLKYFKEISKIPRESGNEEKIADYLCNFAKKNKLEYVRDNFNNVIIKTKGLGKPIAFQAHSDMVCVSDDGKFDFKNNSIELINDGNNIKAKGTTLGADDGIGMALILAIISDSSFNKPPIEAIFTTSEETGLYGANGFDTTLISAKKMINLDSEELGIFYNSCAGGCDVVFKKNYEKKVYTSTDDDLLVQIKVDGLKGGHSGSQINDGLINACVLMLELLTLIKRKCDITPVTISGGTRRNSIPNFAECKLIININNISYITKVIEEYEFFKRDEFAETDPDLHISLELKELKSGETFNLIPIDIFDNVLKIIKDLPNGVVLSKGSDVLTSLNLGIMNISQTELEFDWFIRSNLKNGMEELKKQFESESKKLNFECIFEGNYEAWEAKDSMLSKELSEAYKKITGKYPVISSIHAGLECGIFTNKIKYLECLSIGPNIYNAHSTSEILDLKSVNIIYEVLIEYLKQRGQEI